jgi:cytochrome c peroxidase
MEAALRCIPSSFRAAARALTLAGAAVCAVYAVPFQLRGPGQGERSPTPEALAYAIHGTPKVLHRWQRWAREHEARGGDRNVVFTLLDPRHNPPLHGRVELDLLQGRVRAELAGAADAGPLELWLVDDAAGAGNPAGADAQDARWRIGRLEPDGAGALRLERELGPQAFARFEADLVAVSPVDRGAEQALVSAQAGLFQTLYTSLRSGRLYDSEFDRAPGWGVSTAFAQRAPREGRSETFPLEELTPDAEVVLNELVARGADLFFNETFGGNGRTCGTCHPKANNLTLDPAFVASLPDDDPLFVAERVPALAGLDNPRVIRANAAVGLPEDGAGAPRVVRSVPHLFALQTSVSRVPDTTAFDGIGDGGITRPLERTGWGGDLGSAGGGDGSLRVVASTAVLALLPKTLPGAEGTDFRLPTAEELDALEAFQRALGRVNDPLNSTQVSFANAAADRGKVLYFRTDSRNGAQSAGKCSVCHNNFGANVLPSFFAGLDRELELRIGLRANANFDTGVERDPQSQLLDDTFQVPPDGGFGVRPLVPGACTEPAERGGVARGGFGAITPKASLAVTTGLSRENECLAAFNTPPVIEAVDTPPFFHTGILKTIEDIPQFYASSAFDQSAAGRFLAERDTGNQGLPTNAPRRVKAINLTAQDITDIATLLRIVSADENLAQSDELLAGALSSRAQQQSPEAIAPLLRQALEELADAAGVVNGLQPGVDPLIAMATQGVRQALDMPPASPAQSQALAAARTQIGQAKELFFAGRVRLYRVDMPRVPAPR